MRLVYEDCGVVLLMAFELEKQATAFNVLKIRGKEFEITVSRKLW
jgi:hypothetical protein